MERYLKIAKVNLKFNLFPHIIVAIIFCAISPFIMNIRNLDNLNTAKILDIYISLIGIVIFVPLFLPEQDRYVEDLIRSKKESILIIYVIRIIEAMLFLFIIVIGFLLYLKGGNCIFPFMKYFYGTISTCVFLGGLGVLVYAIINNIPVAYMIPVLYYIICYGGSKKYLEKFYLFSMLQGGVENKIYLLISGLIMILMAILIKSRLLINIYIKLLKG